MTSDISPGEDFGKDGVCPPVDSGRSREDSRVCKELSADQGFSILQLRTDTSERASEDINELIADCNLKGTEV